jgi:hypothetical protein
MYEHHKQNLAPKLVYYRRIIKHLGIAILVLGICLGMGIVGYHYTAGIPWLDSFHNASMILSGMGPVVEITTAEGKWFSSIYALFSGVVFITNVGIILTPPLHRMFHRFHLGEDV